ncbi:germination protein, Ger(x)C family [Paenibacillus sp. UNC496MF]|uniref:Ger(x)C family spore germination protein n=1 Tax=Paenibacillus sp. UNC496MF TaxID=1502753 RepID=UPI0008E3B746|nr:Ger(x)C family spore germination protein [Paenibacillus sp. UNC496MF]SFI40569.1 germination protein, Ger(x)C family [Paenibacillus sp. UNC496MF]
MRKLRRTLLGILLAALLAGCSPDIQEISDIALVMLTAIDYDAKKQEYVFTVNCLNASTNSTQNTRKLEWVASSTGKSIFEAARNLRSHAGKVLIWQHDKFFLVGESAARHSLYEVVDFLTRSRDIRLSSYLIIGEGSAADMMRSTSESGDLISNEIVGKIKNEKYWGKSMTLTIKDIANDYMNPYRGLATGKLSKSKTPDSDRDVLFLNGGSVIHKGKLAGWISGKDVLSLHILLKKKEWGDLQFSETVPFRSAKLSLQMKVDKRSIRMTQTRGKPGFDIRIRLSGSIKNLDKQVNAADPAVLREMEETTGRYVEQQLRSSIRLFQRDLKIDLIGLADIARRYHPNAWEGMKDDWVTDIYPAMPIRVRVDVAIPTIGMSEALGGT